MNHLFGASLTVLALAAAGAAIADPPAPSSTPAAPSAAAAEPTTQLNEVVVTAEKFNRTLQSTATSVGVVTAKDIAAQNMLEVRDAYEELPNVGIAGANNRFEIRGIPFDNVLGAGYGQLGTLYVDGVRMADKSTRFGPDLLWDVNAINVLRGAQSTLQGRNALAGSIYINTNEPSWTWSGAARGEISNGQGQDEAIAISGPLIDHVLAFRLTAENHGLDGFVYDPTLGRQVGFDYDTEFRGKLLFTPIQELTVHVVAAYADTKRRDAPSDVREIRANGFELPNATPGYYGFQTGVVAPGAAPGFVNYTNVLEYDSTRTLTGGVVADYRPIHGLTFTSSTSLLYVDNNNIRDGDAGNFQYPGYAGPTIPIVNPYGIGNLNYASGSTVPVNPYDEQNEKFHTFDQELRLRWDNGGRFRALVGAYYTHETREETNFTMYVYTGVQTLATATAESYHVPTATANYFGSFYSNDAPLYTFNAEPVRVENFAFYTEDEYDLTHRLTLDVGLRYDQEHNVSGVITSGNVLGLANPTVLGGVSPSLGALASAINSALNPFRNAQDYAGMDFHALLPKIGVRYKLNEDITVGATAQKGYRAGGVSVNVVRQLATTLAPEYTWNYELFLRSHAFDNRLRFNANVFYTDWDHQQVAVNLSSISQDTLGVNAGHSALYGFEAQLNGDLTRNITLHSGVGYDYTQFLSFDVTVPANAALAHVTVPAGVDANLRGKEFPYAPRWNGNVGGTYHVGAFSFDLNANYQGVSYSDVQNTEKDGARLLINARTAYDMGPVTVSLFVRNLLNRTYVQDASPTNPLLGQPRLFGAVLQAKF